MTKRIPLRGIKGKGKYMLVSDEDYDTMSKFCWYLNDRGYAIATLISHQSVMGIFDRQGRLVDHINGDRLDNRRENLRIATNQQNMQNRKLDKRNKSGYKGVVKRERYTNRPYAVFIGVGAGKAKYLGAYTTPEEAARVYDKTAKDLFGEFARLNFPEDE